MPLRRGGRGGKDWDHYSLRKKELKKNFFRLPFEVLTAIKLEGGGGGLNGTAIFQLPLMGKLGIFRPSAFLLFLFGCQTSTVYNPVLPVILEPHDQRIHLRLN